MKKSLYNFLLVFFSISIIIIIYALLIIPYKVFTNSARSESTEVYAQFHDEYGYKPNKNVSSIVNLKYIGRTYNIITDFSVNI